jgi:hypothetical protein
LSLDVFLESADEVDRAAVEAALARNGLSADSIATTADGGEANVSLDEHGAAFVVRTLTPELAQVIFDVAESTRLAILPADGTPTALVAGEANVPDELEPVEVADAAELLEELRHSEGLRAARQA